jgi:hypothetical protein
MENNEVQLQSILNKVFLFNGIKVGKRIQRDLDFLRTLNLNKIVPFTNEVLAIHNKQSELSARHRSLISSIYQLVYKEYQKIKDSQELDNGSEGAEGEVIKVK